MRIQQGRGNRSFGKTARDNEVQSGVGRRCIDLWLWKVVGQVEASSAGERSPDWKGLDAQSPQSCNVELLAGFEASLELPWLDRNSVQVFMHWVSETEPKNRESGWTCITI